MIYWAPTGALVYAYLSDDTEGRHIFVRFGVLPEEMSVSDLWKITPRWMQQELTARRMELYPDGLAPDVMRRIEEYNNN